MKRYRKTRRTRGEQTSETFILSLSARLNVSLSPRLFIPLSLSIIIISSGHTVRFDLLSHRAVESDQGGPRDDVLSDVEFFDFGHSGARTYVAISQAVARRDIQSGLRRQTRGGADTREFFFDFA